MSNETLKTINDLLRVFNDTFVIEANILDEGQEKVADGLKIASLKQDGGKFIDSLIDIFNTIIKSISDEHELIYDEKIGLAIARKIVKTDYKIEEF